MARSRKKRKASAQDVPHGDPEESTPETHQGILEPSAPTHRMGHESSKLKASKSITALGLSSDDKLITIALEKRISIYKRVGSTFKFIDESGEEPINILQLSFAPNATTDKIKVWYLNSEGKILDPSGVQKVDMLQLSTEAAEGITTKLVRTHGWRLNEKAILPIQQAIKDTLSKALDTHMSEYQTKLEGNTALFSPDGKFMICFTQDEAFRTKEPRHLQEIIVWDIEARRPRHNLTSNSGTFLWVSISPDSKLIAAIQRDNTVLFWSADSGNLKSFPCLTHTAGAWSGRFSPDSKQIALVLDGTGPSKIRIFNIATRAMIFEWECPAFSIESMDWSPNGKLLATAGHSGEFILWDVTNGLERMKWLPYQRGVEDDPDSYLASDIQFFDGGKKLVYNWSGVATMVYDFVSLAMHEFPSGAAGIRGRVCSSNSEFLLIAHNDSTLRQWKLG
ncbi:WD40 repeat domain-containing protein [Aspergillus neoniger CBS 115656]|uniref:WD40 repeat-like protein n=1 Tax=Aspergillus neoniger (strain CBS 115656) TaxID=1448310 RepID=A0A318YFE7_ASPNB|nr:WD40 repeat-like protein [Aspergillus neoniger CBS 115656]PYH33086.1 WD40 repeat-like protein [Aspergillus neoniger CBS 115656]